MYDYVIIHGSYGHPFENWEPWLFETLTSEGKQVLAPQFPCINQSYDNWKRVMDAYRPFIDENTSFIGHSLGPAFIINYLLDNKLKVNNLYFAVPFYGLINNKDFDEVNKTFFKYNDISEATKYFNNIISFFGDNDPYVPAELVETLTHQLNSPLKIIHNGGHLNASAGLNIFKELKDAIDEN